MNFLPNEIIAQVFSYIHPIYSNLLEIRLVSRKWRRIIENTPFLWKHIHLDDDRDSVPDALQVQIRALKFCLEKFGPYIQCLRAEEQEHFHRVSMRNLISSLSNLRKLDIPLLVWTRPFAAHLKNKSMLKYVTIDDCKIIDTAKISSLEKRRATLSGLRGWDFRFFHSWFPNLEILCLHTSIFKIRRGSMVSILNPMKLQELHLELTPYSLKAEDQELSNAVGAPCVREIMNSRHCSTLTSLELRYLSISSRDLMEFTKGLKGLKHFVVGSIASMNNETLHTALFLESQSLRVLFLSSLPSSWTQAIKIVMPCLEVLVITQCLDLSSLAIHAPSLLTLVLRDNLSLKNILTKCENITDIELQECNEFEMQSFKKLLRDCPSVSRIELSVEWESIELKSQECTELRKIIIRDADMALSRVKIDCPTLEVFKCIGHCVPRKTMRKVHFRGCEFEITCQHLKKLNICNVYHTTSISVQCHSIDTVDLSGRTILLRPLDINIKSLQIAKVISLHELSIKSITIRSPSVGDVILRDCCMSYGDHKCTMRVQCADLRAFRLIKCDKIKKFSLRVPRVGNLTLDSCAKLRELDINVKEVERLRIVNCPLLNNTNDI